MNDLALKGEIAVLGSTYMADFPFYELINKCKPEYVVYNRSIEGLTPQEANEILPVAVLALKPRKVFLCFEEDDVRCQSEAYVAMIERIKAALPNAELFAVTLSGEGNLPKLPCDGKRVHHISLSPIGGYKSAFKRLCCFFRERPVDIADAFTMAAL